MIFGKIDNVDIVAEIKTDHSAITLHVNEIDETANGPSYWKFNASLLEDERYVTLINEKYDQWREEGVEIQVPRVLWDFIKYKIRIETITYSKQVAKERSEKLPTLERNIQEYAMKCGKDRTSENLNNLEVLQTEYDRQFDYIARGAMMRSRANWYEQGGKSNKYFLNLESSRKEKSCIRKVCKANEEHTTDPREIMGEIHTFYSTLYDKPLSEEDSSSLNSFLVEINTKTLTEGQRDALEEKITVKKYYESIEIIPEK